MKHTERPSAALVLLYGSAHGEHRRQLLDRDALLVGRGRGCDLILEAPDVSSIHCVITRTAGGYTVRDCGSRAGTRLNGEPIREATLHDGDLIKVGPFTFRLELPPARQVPARALRHERQRRNFARLALALRRRLHELQHGFFGAPPTGTAGTLGTRASGLRQRVRDFQQRLRRLEQAERDLARDRDTLRREQQAFRDHVHQVEAELARRQAGACTSAATS